MGTKCPVAPESRAPYRGRLYANLLSVDANLCSVAVGGRSVVVDSASCLERGVVGVVNAVLKVLYRFLHTFRPTEKSIVFSSHYL